ncbi:MAG: acetylglutamate kinase, partial [Bacteroidales bacterium]|nr:acetylglutamate kinase [Bacteroidales bacterium]
MISVYKVGGNVMDDPAALDHFCRQFAAVEGQKVIVHGGGVRASQVQKALGQEPVKIEGRRVTDAQTLEVVTMVYA